jgi:PAS domain S-box-containing protein
MPLLEKLKDTQEENFARIFEQMYDPALLIDPEAGSILAANHAALLLLGYEADELASLTPSDIHPHEIPRFEVFIKTVLEKERWTSDELSCRTKSGEMLPAEIRATSVQVFGRSCILALVHDRRTEKLAVLGQALRKVVHDLRGSLSTAQLLSDRLSTHADPQVQGFAKIITQSIERTVSICQQTLKVGHAGEHPPHRVRFILSDILDEVRNAIGGVDSGIAVVDNSSSTIEIHADFDQFFRILLNLVRNAKDAGAGAITVKGHYDRANAIVDIADDGPGLPESLISRLFEGRWEMTSSESSGLGLNIAKELAENHDGDLELLSTGKDGAVFRLSLPQP